MANNKKINKILFTLLFVLSLSLCLFSKTNIVTNADSDIPFNYSADYETSKSFTYNEVLNLLIDEPLTSSEQAYFDATYQNNICLKLDELVPQSLVTSSLSLGVLTVEAQSYQALDYEFNVHEWVPTIVTVGEKEATFSKNGEGYVAIVSDVTSSDKELSVTYSCEFSLEKDYCNSLINLSYDKAKAYVDSHVEEDETAKYNLAYQAYQDYLNQKAQYDLDVVSYQNYLEEKDDYDLAYAAYQKYLIEEAKYQEDYKKYQAYLKANEEYTLNLSAYNKYLKDLETYNELKTQYDSDLIEYNQKMAIISHQLAVMEAIKTPMTSLERTVYDAIMGETVTNVLGMREDLEILQAEEDAIDRAGVATINLREIFTSYFSCETDQEKYSFYCYSEKLSAVNYKKLKDNLEELLRCLDKLYRSGRVKEALNIKGKTEKYLILVAQLALLCNALDDNPVYNYEAWNATSSTYNLSKTDACVIDENWKIECKTFREYLTNDENDPYISDTTIKAYPYIEGYPSALTEPTKPTEVANPGSAPTKVAEPIQPVEVENPGSAPIEVENPGEAPSKVDEPTPYTIPSDISQIVSDYKNGLIQERNELDSDYILSRTTLVTKSITQPTLVKVEFYNTDNSLITIEETEVSSYILYNKAKPEKAGDDQYESFTFTGWVYEDGEKLDLTHVTRSGKVYPTFVGTLKKYLVTWKLGEEIIESCYYEYGSLPTLDNELYQDKLVKETTGNSYYEFSGWNKEYEVVTGNQEYSATFNTYSILSEGSLKVSSDQKTLQVTYEETSSNQTIEFGKLVSFYDAIHTLDIIYDDVSLSLTKATIKQMKQDNVTKFGFDATLNQDYDYSFCFNCFDSNEALIDSSSYTVEVVFQGTFDETHSALYYEQNEELVKVKSTVENNLLTFTMMSGVTYSYYPIYTVSINQNEDCLLIVEKNDGKKNDEIVVVLGDIALGKQLENVYCVDANKNEIEIEWLTEKSFKVSLPSNDIYFGVNTSDINYVVRFYSGETVISQNTYHYQDKIILPNNPTKLSDELFSYEFTGWDLDIEELVTESRDYHAVFEQTELKKEEIVEQDSKIIPILITLGCTMVLAISGVVVFIIIKKKKLKRNKTI